MNLFDLHADTLTKAYEQGCDFNSGDLAVSNDKASRFNKYYQSFAICTERDGAGAWEKFENVISHAQRILGSFNGRYILSAENLSCLEQRLDRIRNLWYYGVKTATLTWNYFNGIAGGALCDKGLTPFGQSVIDELNRCKIAVDLSHLNEKSFYEVVERADVCLATHTALNEVKPHPRNIDITRAKLIGEKGGIIGVCFYPEFSSYNIFDGILRNIYLLLENVGEQSVAIGSDFDGATMSPQLDNIEKVHMLRTFLEQNGIPNTTLENIFFRGAYKFFKGNGLI